MGMRKGKVAAWQCAEQYPLTVVLAPRTLGAGVIPIPTSQTKSLRLGEGSNLPKVTTLGPGRVGGAAEVGAARVLLGPTAP